MNHASIALVGTYPPTQCGLATFTRSSATALSQNRRVGVVELLDSPRGNVASMVAGSWVRGNRQSMLAAVRTIETYQAVVIEHEFGIFGGIDGDEVLELVRVLTIPVVSVVHTVLEQPSPHQRFILEELARYSEAVVTLTETARRRLLRTISVDPSKLFVIPHGAHEVRERNADANSGNRSNARTPTAGNDTKYRNVCSLPSARSASSTIAEWPNSIVSDSLRFQSTRALSPPPYWSSAVPKFQQHRPPIVLTWGLLGPGKGIENAIDAVAALKDMKSPPQYWIVGETHPKVREASGEQYRASLVKRADDAGIAHLVKFFDGYRDLSALHDLIAQADLVVLPYESREQVTSGVLVEAIAAGLPVVATDFPHARELLALGCGIVVEHDDSSAMAQAIREILTNDPLRSRLRATARKIAPSLFWPEVGRSFGVLVDRCVSARTVAINQSDQSRDPQPSMVG
jgi:polysaccharide biosynthesis protein PslF